MKSQGSSCIPVWQADIKRCYMNAHPLKGTNCQREAINGSLKFHWCVGIDMVISYGTSRDSLLITSETVRTDFRYFTSREMSTW